MSELNNVDSATNSNQLVEKTQLLNRVEAAFNQTSHTFNQFLANESQPRWLDETIESVLTFQKLLNLLKSELTEVQPKRPPRTRGINPPSFDEFED